MIKLIATDMDGTLLDENSNLPKNFFETLDKLNEMNVKFVVASGRPYKTLYENFKPYSDDLYFICDNGSYIVEPGKKPNISIIDKSIVKNIIKACEDIPNTTVILCGVKSSYHKPCSKEMEKEISKYYLNKEVVSDLNNIEDDIFKIAICDFNGSKENSYKILDSLFGDNLKVVVSGSVWVDINNKNINKGEALKKIQKDFNISYDETMAFGDFYNDVEMLKSAYYSFVMENANEDMKQYGNFIAKSNKENGVIKSIEKYVLAKDNILI
ncbi:MAG: HAD family phosphatase [Clostridium sp.]|nr:HAD family phosphatase [Clostridium sp.]